MRKIILNRPHVTSDIPNMHTTIIVTNSKIKFI